ncbi:hypothetical protein Cadr_000011713 [Camelus dromedarius]|uniref:Uncharacterized protein n=1 Tax=Camelus dromedarius TaxID=9838 RepID=A0A5N4DR03_CAMDR|nr:hypothetical protein Cadr_000011713 [Camelus dromedarius]
MRPLAPVMSHTHSGSHRSTFTRPRLHLAAQPLQSHSAPHTPPITPESPGSQSRTATISHRASHLTAQSRITFPGYFLWPPSSQAPLQAHTVSHPKNYTHAEARLTLGQRGAVGPAALTHTHTLTRPGTEGHAPFSTVHLQSSRRNLGAGTPSGKKLTEDTSHAPGLTVAPMGALRGPALWGPARRHSPHSPRRPVLSAYLTARVRGSGGGRRQQPGPRAPAPAHSEHKPTSRGLHFPEAPAVLVSNPEGPQPCVLGGSAPARELVEAWEEVCARDGMELPSKARSPGGIVPGASGLCGQEEQRRGIAARATLARTEAGLLIVGAAQWWCP